MQRMDKIVLQRYDNGILRLFLMFTYLYLYQFLEERLYE
jgi:hypothetical protein